MHPDGGTLVSSTTSNLIPFKPRPDRQPAAPHTEPTTPAPVVPITGSAVYTVAEVAHMLSLSRGSTYTLVRSGQIPALKLGGRWVIPKRRFHTWLDNLPEATTDDLDRELRRAERREARQLNRTS
jgi:excisionase family DNA binding protein